MPRPLQSEFVSTFPARRVLLGVAGSIAAAAAPQIAMYLRHIVGLEVRAVLTRQAATMVAPRALAVATGRPVLLDEDETAGADPAVPHLEATRWADLFLILPASANLLVKAAHGIADDASRPASWPPPVRPSSPRA